MSKGSLATFTIQQKFGFTGNKLKAFAEDKLNATQMFSFVFDVVENIVSKRKKSGNLYLPLFPKCF